jgi:putative membrane protein
MFANPVAACDEGGAKMSEFLHGATAFFGYFGGAIAFFVAFGAIYLRLTPHREFDLIVREHNASASIALSGTLLGYAIALAGAIRNTRTVWEFVVWACLAALAQLIAYGLARLTHPNLSTAIESNAIAAAIWLATISISAGVLCDACMSP